MIHSKIFVTKYDMYLSCNAKLHLNCYRALKKQFHKHIHYSIIHTWIAHSFINIQIQQCFCVRLVAIRIYLSSRWSACVVYSGVVIVNKRFVCSMMTYVYLSKLFLHMRFAHMSSARHLSLGAETIAFYYPTFCFAFCIQINNTKKWFFFYLFLKYENNYKSEKMLIFYSDCG